MRDLADGHKPLPPGSAPPPLFGSALPPQSGSALPPEPGSALPPLSGSALPPEPGSPPPPEPGPPPPEPSAAPSAAFYTPMPPTPGHLAISIRSLTKRFGPKVAVEGVSLDIEKGSFFGLLGPNGAGKSTTLSMVTGLLRPDEGTVAIAGKNVWADPVSTKRIIGVLPEDLRLFERLSGAELLGYLGRIRGMDPDVVEQRADELLTVLGLAEDAGKLVTDYSQGMRKKIGLAAALLHAPSVLFLDEPFESVDPLSARTIRTVLERYTDSGATVVFSSHVMAIVDDLCDHVAVMNFGRLIASGPIEQVRAGQSLEEAFVSLLGASEVGEESLAWLRHSSD